MEYYMSGTIRFDRDLTKKEADSVQALFGASAYAGNDMVEIDDAFTHSVDDTAYSIQAWSVEHKIPICDDSYLSYSGDDEGRLEWTGDKWDDSSRDECAVRDATDDSLMHELIRRGYFAITNARLIEILVGYVESDLEAADPDYVREVLIDTCGCTDAELRAIGLGLLVLDEE